eukprot:CAMPEP_0202454712 /NCGR_PEP_ID=MMETSP1360-20130828/12377_1 /ASSEMBLY_ACC=CAM_ASM_000848 /TAXON_ID=515479 /ORGANISM="Licmophora paradoxa, Strain CCMP2313" /LENGTH=84 /DNA_ID=CAMNT_0049074099 /DNA_START=46 /DNA_END=297 /DNA_ORIENTATION=-
MRGPNSSKNSDNSKYKLYNLELDRLEQHDVASQFPHVVEELAIKMEEYKATFVPEPEEKHCPGHDTPNSHKVITPTFGAAWMPW